MKERKRTIISWSSGKDSAWVLHRLRQAAHVEIVGLFTTLNARHARVSMHATPRAMLRQQADAAGLPLREISLPDPCPMEVYGAIMRDFVGDCHRAGITHMAFGDLFLDDIRAYREKQLAGTGIEPMFPLWGSNTAVLAGEMLDAGLTAHVSSVDLKQVPAHFAGRLWTRELLAELPPACDPCGEHGEIHTVVVDGPMFAHPIPARVGEIVQRDGFAYADIIPVGNVYP